MRQTDLPSNVVRRRAIVYVRQSTNAQVETNLESQRSQYDLVARARDLGFRDVAVIDDDLGRSAGGVAPRPGFESLVAQICAGGVGAVFCLEPSRLARNGRDWHHLLELCGLVGARVFDADGAYDLANPNDRLLLGLKGTMSEFELAVLRRRLGDAVAAKARRGELRMPVPVGYLWLRDTGLEINPDARIQRSIRSTFAMFERLGSARQVLIEMREQGLLFARSASGHYGGPIEWKPPSYASVIHVLRNPFYAGAYAYGKSRSRTVIVDGRAHRTYGHDRPREEWTVLLHDHHAGYISWEQFERNQELLRRNAFGKPSGGAKSGRGGHALLSGLLRCRRCGRMLHVVYSGGGRRRVPTIRYTCNQVTMGLPSCVTFGARRPDEAVANQLLDVVQPLAIEAAMMAEEQVSKRHEEQLRALDLERQQAEYELGLARRRYESVDPENRLVASELESRWNAALARLRECDARITAATSAPHTEPDLTLLHSLAEDLRSAWHAPATTMRVKQQLLRTLVREIVVDVDDVGREIQLIIHWRGGQHSEVCVRKPASGEHRRKAGVDADAVIRDMATRWTDQHIASTLNRMRLPTGQGKNWNAVRVRAYRRTAGISDTATTDDGMLALHEAAHASNVTVYAMRKLIEQGAVPARQVAKHAPWRIAVSDLRLPQVQEALRRFRRTPDRPRRASHDNATLKIPGI